jgi:L-seryl-tRNA(Ser) seleniumtransferase
MSPVTHHGLFSRRRFLSWSQAALAALGTSPLIASPSEAFAAIPPARSADDYYYYAKLGVEKILNAAGTYTYLKA